MKKGFTLIELMIVIAVIGLLSAVVLPRFGDSTMGAKAAQVHGNLKNLQTGIDMFYVGEGHYPELKKDIGAGEDGNGFSEAFEKYYSKGRMPETPAGGKDISSDLKVRRGVYPIGERNLIGGWLYDEERGKIYARLVEDSYGQGNIWVDERELSNPVNIYDGTTLTGKDAKDRIWTSEDTFSEYTMETTFEIGDPGRMEIYLEGSEDGYKLRIHPMMQKVYLIDRDGNRVEANIKGVVSKDTWFSGKDSNKVPIKVDVSDSQGGKKQVSLEIGGEKISFGGSESVEYTPKEDSSPIGIGNKPGKDRPLEVGSIKVTSK